MCKSLSDKLNRYFKEHDILLLADIGINKETISIMNMDLNLDMNEAPYVLLYEDNGRMLIKEADNISFDLMEEIINIMKG